MTNANHQNLTIKQKSHEIITPSTPTPPGLTTFPLSFIDQNFPPVHLPLLLLYPTTGPTGPTGPTDPTGPTYSSVDDIVTTLKKTLAETLSLFYPLAGRCMDRNTVSCNDLGVPFVETEVDVCLDDALSSSVSKIDVYVKLLPPKELFCYGQLPLSEISPLAFQVNVFLCGSIVIGCYMLHKLLDAASISTFFNYWAGLAQGRAADDIISPALVQPNFETTVSTFPPPSTVSTVDDSGSAFIAMLWNRPSQTKVVAKSFVFTNPSIKTLKINGSSEAVPTPTSFEAVVGFVWRHVTPPESPSLVSFNANIRNRTSPPLPKGCMGNLLIGVHPRVEKRVELSEFIKSIRTEVTKLDTKVECLKGENGVKDFLEFRSSGAGVGTTSYNLSSWCKLGLDQVDFGFGKPGKIVPYGMVNPLLRNSIMLVDYSDSNGDGIEVWMFLEEKEMEGLESDAEFFEFALPS